MKFSNVGITAVAACVLSIASTALGYENSFTNKSTKTVQITVNWKCGRTETLTIAPNDSLSCQGSCPVLFINLDVEGERVGRWVPISKVVGHFFNEGNEPQQSLEYVGDGSWLILDVSKRTVGNEKNKLTLWKVK